MSIRIERLADRVLEDIKEEIEDKTPEEISVWFRLDSDRLIHESIERQMPTANWEILEFVTNDTDLGFPSDIHMLENHENIFTFLLGRIFEELQNDVMLKVQEMQAEEPSPDDYFDDGEALASAGWGTDEDYGMASEML